MGVRADPVPGLCSLLLREESRIKYSTTMQSWEGSWNSYSLNAANENQQDSHLRLAQGPSSKTRLCTAHSQGVGFLEERWEGNRHSLGTVPGSQVLTPFAITTALSRGDCFPVILSGQDCLLSVDSWDHHPGLSGSRASCCCRWAGWALRTEPSKPPLQLFPVLQISKGYAAHCYLGCANAKGPAKDARGALNPPSSSLSVTVAGSCWY